MKKLGIILAAFVLSGCFNTQYNTATGRQETILYSSAKEVRMGEKLSRKIERKYGLSDDEEAQKRVKEIGAKIASVSDRDDIPYHFAVIDDEEVNALALPGGYVYVSQGLMDAAESDDEVAAVIAHEVGHVAARHSMKQLQGEYLYTFLTALTLAGNRDRNFFAGSNFSYISLMMQYSRQYEKEADQLSVRYLKRAGYDTNAALSMLDKLDAIDAKKPERVYTYFRSHPPIDMRQALIRTEITGELDYESYLDMMDVHEESN
jgi:predicted Zn-dependent protease